MADSAGAHPLSRVGLLIAVAALSIACGAQSTSKPEASPVTTSGPEVAAAVESSPFATPDPMPAPVATPSPVAPGYDPNITMFRLFSGANHPTEFTLQALDQAAENNDVSQVPVIVEVLRFLASQEVINKAVSTLQLLTNQEFGGGIDGWREWTEWHGEHAAEFQPPEGYVEWKSNLLSIIDPRFGVFLESADETSRIDLAELLWGGVRPDGIPDLQSPPNIPANEANYLRPDERVFGVSIKGQHRAYPLRIMNAHEMANDVWGGEPIALAY